MRWSPLCIQTLLPAEALSMAKKEVTLHCSFCGKSNHEVAKMVSARDIATICVECWLLCFDDFLEHIDVMITKTITMKSRETTQSDAKGEHT
jgi:hypothetical protein